MRSPPLSPRLPLALVLGGLLAGSLALAPGARAIYGPAAGGFGADIVSVDNAAGEQSDAQTVNADISANGRYVVFQTRATNFFEDDGGVLGAHGVEPDAEPPGTLREGGIFRYDRVTGAIALVADGSEVHTEGSESGNLIFRGAANPSVSADGRYVVFSTAQQLVPQDKNDNVDVYRRDMNVPLNADRKDSGAYTIVSAKDGGKNRRRTRRTARRCPAPNRARKCGPTPPSPRMAATSCSERPNRSRTCPTIPPLTRRRESCSCATCRRRRRPC